MGASLVGLLVIESPMMGSLVVGSSLVESPVVIASLEG